MTRISPIAKENPRHPRHPRFKPPSGCGSPWLARTALESLARAAYDSERMMLGKSLL
jgi:hypothetical protein